LSLQRVIIASIYSGHAIPEPIPLFTATLGRANALLARHDVARVSKKEGKQPEHPVPQR
jgi:hypothetical protein